MPICGNCRGTGKQPGYAHDCSMCHGTGQVSEGELRFAVVRSLFFLLLFAAIAIAILYFFGPQLLATIRK